MKIKDIQTNLENFKLISAPQLDLSYFNLIAPQVFSDSSVYSAIQSDVQFILQAGGQLFSYLANTNPSSQKLWYATLSTGVNQCIEDANNVISQIPTDSSRGPDLLNTLQILIADCQAIQSIIPVNKA